MVNNSSCHFQTKVHYYKLSLNLGLVKGTLAKVTINVFLRFVSSFVFLLTSLLLQLANKIKLKIWHCRSNVDKTAQLNKFYLTQWALFYLLYMIILLKFEVAILKMIYNILTCNNLTLKVTGRMILPLLSHWVLIIMKNNLSAH